MAMRTAARLFTQSVRASAPLAAAGSLAALASPPEASCAWWRRDAAAKEAERKAALSPLERLAEFAKDVQMSDGPAAVAELLWSAGHGGPVQKNPLPILGCTCEGVRARAEVVAADQCVGSGRRRREAR